MYEQLMERVATEENCQLALQAVKRNHGAAGIDRMTTDQLEEVRVRVFRQILPCKNGWVQPPDAENRTSGGVGG